MLFDDRPYTLDRVVRLALGVGLAWGMVWLLDLLSDVLVPFAVALLLAYLLDPLVGRTQRVVKNRALAVGSVLVGLTAGLAGTGLIVFPLVGREVTRTARLLSDLVRVKTQALQGGELLPEALWQAFREVLARPEVQDFITSGNLPSMAGAFGRKLLPGVWGVLSGTASFMLWLFGLTVIFMYLVFLLLDFQKVREGWKSLLPVKMRQPADEFLIEFLGAMNRYFRGQALVSAGMGVVAAIGFSLIGLPLGILLGGLVGLLSMVPYLQLVSLIPAVFLSMAQALETGTSLWVLLALMLAVFVVVQLVQDVVLVPRIMGKATGLSPAMMLLSLSVWGKLLGLLGLIIALPMTCLFLAYYRRLLTVGRVAIPGTEETASRIEPQS